MSTRQIFSIPNLLAGLDPQIASAFASLIDQLNDFSYSNSGGVDEQTIRGIISDIGGDDGGIDYTTPPQITGLRMISGQGAIVLMYDRQVYKSFAYAEIWRNDTGSLDGTQQKIGTAGSFIYTDLLPNDPAGTVHYYWIKAVSSTTPPVVGDFNAVAGTMGIVSAGTAANIGPGKLPASSTIDLGDGISLIPTADGEIAIGQNVRIVGTGEGMINLGNNLVMSGAADGTILMGNGLVLDAAADGKIDAGTGITMNGAGAGMMSFGTAIDIVGENEGAINVGGDVLISGIGQGHIDLGEGAVTLGGDGSIIIATPGGIASHDYVILTDGEIQYMVWDGTQHIEWKSLRQVAQGVANSGDVVSIGTPGNPIFFKNEPRVTVSINTLMAYSASHPLQSQQWEVSAENLREDPPGSGYWKFDGTCRLAFAGASGSKAVNYNASNSVDDSYIHSSIQHTDLNCIAITPNVSGRSTEFAYTSGGKNYFKYKYLRWRVAYSTNSSLAGALYTSVRTKAIGATFGDVTDSMTVSGLAKNRWYFRVEYYFSDAGGVFASGATQYLYNSDTISNAASSEALFAYEHGGTSTEHDGATFNLPSYSPPAGYTIYSVDYSGSYAYFLKVSGSGSAMALASVLGLSFSRYGAGNIGGTPFPQWHTRTWSATSLDLTHGPAVDARGSSGTSAEARAQVKALSAVVKSKKPVGLSTTPSNHTTFISFFFTLDSATQISAGVFAWQAIGQ